MQDFDRENDVEGEGGEQTEDILVLAIVAVRSVFEGWGCDFISLSLDWEHLPARRCVCGARSKFRWGGRGGKTGLDLQFKAKRERKKNTCHRIGDEYKSSRKAQLARLEAGSLPT